MNVVSTDAETSRPAFFILIFLFIGSGASALIYEVAWFHLLRFTIGSSTLSLGILLAAFMGGLCIGSLICHRLIAVRHHPLRVYALLELGIGLCGIAIPLILPLVSHLYFAWAGYGPAGIFLRALVCVVLLIPPTVLMGATLPAIARWIELTALGYAHLGLLYSANIVGAVIGTALAGFYLLRVYDVYFATGVAVAFNMSIALIGLALALRHRSVPEVAAASGEDRYTLIPVHAVIALSGLTALGAQVVWTRILSLLLGGTVYTFSVILAVFLTGLGIGGGLGSYTCRQSTRPDRMLAVYQGLLVPSIFYACYAITKIIPELHFVESADGWIAKCADDVLRVALATLPATLFWGASFPVAVAAAGGSRRDPGKLVGNIYAANTVGAILGALGFSALFIPLIGTRQAQWLLTAGAGMAAAFAMAARAPFARTKERKLWSRRRLPRIAAATTMLAAGVAIGSVMPQIPPGLIGFGREVRLWNKSGEFLLTREGRNASIAVSRISEPGYRFIHINGKVVASTCPPDLRNERMLGHIPALFHPNPKSVLIIGFGAGVTSGNFTLYPSIERIVIVEIEPEVAAASEIHFKDVNYDVLKDPRTEIIFDDARHYVTTTSETFDLISTDPIHPWSKGAAALYTKEFFEICRDRLNPGGFITQWVPLYQTNAAAVKSQIGTFLDVFPHGSIWNSEVNLKGYDVILLGHTEPFVIVEADLAEKFHRNRAVAQSLAEVQIHFPLDLLISFAGRRPDVASWLNGYRPNLDRNLRLEYLAGEALDTYAENEIYAAMTTNLRFPEGFFQMAQEKEGELRRRFAQRYGK